MSVSDTVLSFSKELRMRLKVPFTILALAFALTLAASPALAQKISPCDPTQPLARNWRLAFLRYHHWRVGYESLPLQVVNVSGGKLGPCEKSTIAVSALENRSPKAVKAVKFNWYLFNVKDLDTAVATEQTALVEVNLAPHERRDFHILVVYLEDIPLLRDENPDEEFHLEVAATEIQYEDGSVWEGKNLPEKIDPSKVQR
jgi:hypothetical protein